MASKKPVAATKTAAKPTPKKAVVKTPATKKTPKTGVPTAPPVLNYRETGTPYQNVERRTCLLLDEREVAGSLTTFFTPLDISNGLVIESLAAPVFHRAYHVLEGYPRDRACQLYLSYAQTIGASPEVLKYLQDVTPISPKEHDMATAKQGGRTSGPKTTPAKKAAVQQPDKPKKPTTKAAAKKAVPAKTAAKKAPPKAAKKTTSEAPAKVTASSRFKELILEGKLTDDKIFEKVQQEFDLDEGKRSYVKWYRNKMIKDGVKGVPAAKA
jgi:hypothetical protein